MAKKKANQKAAKKQVRKKPAANQTEGKASTSDSMPSGQGIALQERSSLHMKIFISWSGKLSHKVACVLRDWLPSVIQAVEPYVSSEDIDKGARWSTDIAGQLEESSFGIIAVTQENLGAPWVHFEAGALSKSIDKSNVCPFLFNVKRAEVQGPLLQFQSTVFEREDVKKLVASINGRLPDNDQLSDPQLDRAFYVWWPHLESELENLSDQKGEEQKKAKTPSTVDPAMVEEILDILRQQQRVLNDPESLVPSTHIRRAVDRAKGPLSERPHGLSLGRIRAMMVRALVEVTSFFQDNPGFLDEKLKGAMASLYEQYNTLRRYDDRSERKVPTIFTQREETQDPEE